MRRYASALASILTMAFLLSDRFSLVTAHPALETIHPGFIAGAIFLSTLDLCRAFLLQSSQLGPCVLRL